MNYDTMSVHDLVNELANWGRYEKKRFVSPKDMMMIDRSALESALRSAVIREASVGTMTKTARQKGSVEWNLPSKRFHAGTYRLIPEETP